MPPARVNNEVVPVQATEEESEAETQTDTDAESAVSAGSSSVNAMAWQDDPEFQAKVRWVENCVYMKTLHTSNIILHTCTCTLY